VSSPPAQPSSHWDHLHPLTQTIKQALVRAKHKIANARIPYRVPPANALPQRVPGVLTVLYLVFNEGYSASAGDDLIRRDLCDHAVALTQVLAELLPEEPEANGLLALMLFHRARGRWRG